MRRLNHQRIAAFAFVILLFTQIIIFSSPASATTLLAVIAAQSQRATPTPTPPPPAWPPVINITPLGPLPSAGAFPFQCEYIDLGEDSGGFVTPVCSWLDVGVGGSHSDGEDLSFCVCARVDVGNLLERLFKD